MPLTIEHDRNSHRFTALVDDHLCLLEYRLAGGVMTITHTGVPTPVRNRGIAAELVRSAFQAARNEGWQVVPACSYAAAFARRHSEYADLIVD